MTDVVSAVLTSDVRMALGQCKPEEIFTERELQRWARARYPEDVFTTWELESWASENGWLDEDAAGPDADRVVKENNTPHELLDFLMQMDREMGRWEFTKLVREWAVAEMSKHELAVTP